MADRLSNPIVGQPQLCQSQAHQPWEVNAG